MRARPDASGDDSDGSTDSLRSGRNAGRQRGDPPAEARPADPQRVERLLPAASLPEDADSEACATCGMVGLLTACDGCDRHFHWHCERPEAQPDGPEWFCRECAPARDPPWQPRPDAPLRKECVICAERKPATQFAKLLPECPCPEHGNVVCALCACTLVQTAQSNVDDETKKCPTCRASKTGLELRDGRVVPLEHVLDSVGEGGEGAEMVVEEGEEEVRQAALGPSHHVAPHLDSPRPCLGG